MEPSRRGLVRAETVPTAIVGRVMLAVKEPFEAADTDNIGAQPLADGCRRLCVRPTAIEQQPHFIGHGRKMFD